MTADLLADSAETLTNSRPQRAAAARPRIAAREWERRVRRRVALTDALAVYVAVIVAFVVRFGIGELGEMDSVTVRNHHAITSLVLIVVWLAALWLSDSLDLKLMGAGSQEYARVSNVTIAVFGGAAIVAYLSRWDLGRAYVAIALPLGLVLLNVGRFEMRRLLVAERRAGHHLNRAVVVGCRDTVEHLIAELRQAPQAGIEIVAACITPHPMVELVETTPKVAGVPVVGDIASAAAYVAAHSVDTVVVTGSDEVTPKILKRLAWDLEPHGTDLVVVPGITDVAGPRIHLRQVPGMPLMHVEAPGYSGPEQRLKRAFDVVVSTLLILVFSLPLAVTAVAIKATSPGPVLFKQTRIGMDGKPFQVFKFRSMVVDAEARLHEVLGEEAGIFYKPKNDPRVTRVGAFIRRYSIDELPQLINVLLGSMSLVGPRPQVPLEVEQYDHEVGRRLLVKPGMTGLWQVSGRNNLDLEQSVRLDLYYVDNWSMTEDFLILIRTMRAVVGRDGAY
jgi:exopolysaccharide biosynthesis polyprenyl glycosylphosphotransferase